MKKIIVSVLISCLFGITLANSFRETEASKMKSFFLETLKQNYGEKPEEQLFFDFFTDYKNCKGEVVLRLDKNKLVEMNHTMLADSVYYRYYPRLFFAQSDEEFNKAIGNSTVPTHIYDYSSKEGFKTTKFGLYVNYKYLVDIDSCIDNKAISEIMDYYNFTGLISYFVVADSFLKCTECLRDDWIKEFLAVIFWKYLCDLAEVEFYKIE